MKAWFSLGLNIAGNVKRDVNTRTNVSSFLGLNAEMLLMYVFKARVVKIVQTSKIRPHFKSKISPLPSKTHEHTLSDHTDCMVARAG